MKMIYDVFARKEHAAFLELIGSVEVAGDTNVTQIVLAEFGPESEWLEMVAVPHQAVITVFAEQKEVAR